MGARSWFRCSLVSTAVVLSLFLAGLVAPASAQTIGSFAWQVAPYCNVVWFSVAIDGLAFRLTGFDDQCGGAQLPAAGTAVPRTDGLYAMSFYIVTPNGFASHVTAALNPASISGPWSDNNGATGSLVFNPSLPAGGNHRPPPRLPAAALGTGSATALQIADGAVGTADIADSSVTGTKLQWPLFGVTNTNLYALQLVNNGAGAIRGDANGSGPGVTGIGSTGVLGQSTTGYGVIAIADDGTALAASSSGPAATIRAIGGTGTTAFLENSTPANTSPVVQINSTGTGDFIRALNGSVRFRVTAAGAVQGDGAYTSPAADVAEFIDAADALEPGDVVEIDPTRAGHFRRTTTACSSAVAGVITTKPGVLLNATDERNDISQGPALALSGRVPVKVSDENGVIAPGDLLVAASLAGHAMKAPAKPEAGTVIGKALGNHVAQAGIIEMLVMLR